MMTKMMTKSCKKVAEFYCEKCAYKSVRKSSWLKHLETKKHNDDEMMTKSCKKLQKVAKKFQCECGKKYSYRQGLYVHRKKCSLYTSQLCNTTTEQYCDDLDKTESSSHYNNELTMSKHMIHELTGIVKDLIKSGIYNNSNNTTNINSFNTINKNDIKIFLSNECANALSIQDFVKQLAITVDDLNSTREDTASGIAKIVENNLKPLRITERPMHHIEQDEWYVKDKKKGWSEDDGTLIVNEAQKGIQKKWSKVFEAENPQWKTNENATNNYIHLARTTTQDLNAEDMKIIKHNLSKNCLIGDIK